jgi:hypothetical protein
MGHSFRNFVWLLIALFTVAQLPISAQKKTTHRLSRVSHSQPRAQEPTVFRPKSAATKEIFSFQAEDLDDDFLVELAQTAQKIFIPEPGRDELYYHRPPLPVALRASLLTIPPRAPPL